MSLTMFDVSSLGGLPLSLEFDNDVWVWWVIQKYSDECQHVQCLMYITSKPNTKDFAQKLVLWWKKFVNSLAPITMNV